MTQVYRETSRHLYRVQRLRVSRSQYSSLHACSSTASEPNVSAEPHQGLLGDRAMSLFQKWSHYRYIGETDDEFRTRIIGDANQRFNMIIVLAKLGIQEARDQLSKAGVEWASDRWFNDGGR